MRIRVLSILGILLFSGALAHGGEGTGNPAEPGERGGEKFLFTARKLGIPVLRAGIYFSNGLRAEGKRLLQIDAEVRSLGGLGLLFRMNNRFTSVMDAEACSPLRYLKEINQGGLFVKDKQYHQRISFDPVLKRAVVEGGEEKGKDKERREVPLSSETFDPLSMFGRCYFKEELHPDREIRMSIFDGVSLRRMIFFTKRDRVNSKLHGEIDAVRLESSTSFSTFGDKEGTIRIWYALDGKKTPLAMELGLPIGNVMFELEEGG
jgi:hypothetical protein